ncbi:MAG: carbohydrate-binding protein, partial [Ruminococcus bromii]|nr:carbohydrate-binding protein [Ruminococcus bromii]
MTKTHKLKKSVSLALAFTMLLSLFCIMSKTNVGAVTDRVSMYSSDVTFVKYGKVTRNIYIQTTDNASSQQVYVHYNYMSGEEWRDAQAEYFTTLSDGSKIFKASISSFNDEYAIKYISDGNEYWDNNNGNNYHDEKIGSAPITIDRYGYQTGSQYVVNVVLKNYSYEKDVKVRYTEDNWATQHDVAMHYVSTNDDGTELWAATLNLSNTSGRIFEYCAYYYNKS